jgi:hypothetical protein
VGTAIDPVALEPVDEVVITMLVDNSFDALMSDVRPARRVKPVELATAVASQFVDGITAPGLVAEHGFSALVRVRRGSRVHTLLFDTGVSPDGLAINVERMGIDVSEIEALVLSHGHFDHCGGLAGLSSLGGREGLPLTVHPLVWTRRRLVPPGQPSWELPTLSRQSLEAEGFAVIERRQPSLLLDGSVLITSPARRSSRSSRLPWTPSRRSRPIGSYRHTAPGGRRCTASPRRCRMPSCRTRLARGTRSPHPRPPRLRPSSCHPGAESASAAVGRARCAVVASRDRPARFGNHAKRGWYAA